MNAPQETKFWKRYEKGVEYLDIKNLVNRANKCWNFYSGKQWEGIEADGEDLPFLNFIQPNIKRKVTTIYTNRMAVTYSDMEGRTELQAVYERLSQLFSAKWEKSNQDTLCRKTIKYAAIAFDGIQYYPTENVEDVQLLSTTDVLFGDENEPNIQRQPYIIVRERRLVSEVKELAKKNGISEEEIALIRSDSDTEDTIYNTDEVESENSTDSSKVTLITHFEKKTEPVTKMIYKDVYDDEGNLTERVGELVEDGERTVVYVAKCTKYAMVENERAISAKPSMIDRLKGKQGRSLSLYPLVKFSWEEVPNSARGVSQVEGLIPNQININKTIARRAIITQTEAFPRMAYDETIISNPESLGEVGAPIAVSSGGAQSVNQAIAYLNPPQFSGEPKQLTDDLLDISQELSGSGDTTMGNIDLQRVAASAIVAVNDQAQSMHDETVANLQLFVEDMANLWVELWQVFSPNGISVVTQKTVEEPVIGPDGNVVLDAMGVPVTKTKQVDEKVEISAEELDAIKPVTRIDVTKDNSFTREAAQNVIDGLLEKGYITLEEWVELATDTSPVPKHQLEIILERRKQQSVPNTIPNETPQSQVPPTM